MWFDLYDSTGRRELSLDALRTALGLGGADFFAPRGNSWDSALDDSRFPEPALPALRLRPPEENRDRAQHATREPWSVGSNSFALGGAHTGGGGALLANDMHLGLAVPHVWYRAVLRWTDAGGEPRRLVGITLPGLPLLVAGSNGRVAWGYTVSYADTSDVVVVETESTAQAFYRTAHGYAEIEERPEPIRVRGATPVPFTARWTEWGPLIGTNHEGRFLALRWSAHDPSALDLSIWGLENASTADEAAHLGRGAALPSLNLLAADRTGGIAWTVTGRIPRRIGYDGRYPVSWAYGDRRWDGWLPAEEIPLVSNPADGLLWTANERLVGGEAYAKLGDGGYFNGARGAQIRDALRTLAAAGRPATPADLLALQLDDRARFLARWQQFLLEVLSDEAVAAKASRGELRDAVRRWDGHASVDSAAYRLVRAWRLRVADQVLAPFFDRARDLYPAFDPAGFLYEDALWRLVHERPARLLNPAHPSWDALLLAATDEVVAEAERDGVAPARWTWGAHNTLRMQHPFSRFLPAPLARLLDMPAQPLPGGADMPRIQNPSFGASERLVVAPGREEQGLFHMPGGQSGHPLSPYYRAGHDAWVRGAPTPLLPGPARHVLTLAPR
jgi:penicillin amidase